MTATVLADRLWTPPTARNRAALRTVALVVGFALLTAVLAQIEIKLSFTPVPITGQTLGVLLAGGALGSRLGAASQLVYWMLGLVGLPFYAGGAGGWTNGTGATMGYLVGFVVAAGAIGYLAERKQDRNLASSWSAMALGSIIIYAFGAGWLAHELNIPIATGESNALSLGVTPFLVGDLIKLLLAGALLPAAWAAVDRSK
jgi:biotin transport system substrate-specific component